MQRLHGMLGVEHRMEQLPRCFAAGVAILPQGQAIPQKAAYHLESTLITCFFKTLSGLRP
jgi:hypothetical protein